MASYSPALYATETMILGGGINVYSPPYRWFDKCDGHLTGSVAHLIDKVLTQLEIDYQYTPSAPFKPEILAQFDQQMLAGNIDGRATNDIKPIPGIIYSKAPISSIKISAFYSTQTHTISTMDELKNLKGSALSLSLKKSRFSPVQNFLQRNELPFELISTQEEAIKAIQSGKIDYVMALRYSELLLSKKYFKRYDIEEPVQNFYFAMSTNSPFADRMEEIDREMQLANTSGLVDFLEQRYLLQWFAENDRDCTESTAKTTESIKLSRQ
ncbi:hypothetical protein [Oceanicoccus sagamiensis]|nr:hypothetical protein [Oceanicoccus sagamiensis]